MSSDVKDNVIVRKWQSTEVFNREMGNLMIFSELPA